MNPVFLALDFPTWKEAKHFIKIHQLEGVPVKVGMELFYREGPKVIEALKKDGHPIFLDLKLHDIPTTVERAMQNLSRLEVDYVNVHALGGREMIKRAKEGLLAGSQGGTSPKLLAVTILTSFDETTLHRDLQLRGSLESNVLHFASMAYESGADGVVCSVHEAKKIKEITATDFETVTPGIRLATDQSDDQKRVATPSFARSQQVDKMVIGRSITKAKQPRNAYELALKEWEHGFTD